MWLSNTVWILNMDAIPCSLRFHRPLFQQMLYGYDAYAFVFSVTGWWSFNSGGMFDHIPRMVSRPLLALIGTKCDLSDWREVTTQEGEELAWDLGCTYLETSTKDNDSIEEAFTEIVQAYARIQRQSPLPVPRKFDSTKRWRKAASALFKRLRRRVRG